MLKKLLLFLLGVLALGVLVLGYYGFVPGVSAIFGSNKARDLGAVSSSEAFKSYQAKTGTTFATLPATDSPEKSISFSGSVNTNVSLTAEEIVSIPTNAPWKYFPVMNPQMRFNPDGSTELSGVIQTEKVADYLRAHKLNSAAIDPYLSKLSALGTDVAVYAKGVSSWSNNQMTLETQAIEVGRYSIKRETIDKYNKQIETGIEILVSSVPNLSISSMSVRDGKLVARGTFPKTVSVAAE